MCLLNFTALYFLRCIVENVGCTLYIRTPPLNDLPTIVHYSGKVWTFSSSALVSSSFLSSCIPGSVFPLYGRAIPYMALKTSFWLLLGNQTNLPPPPPSTAAAAAPSTKTWKRCVKNVPRKGHWSLVPWLKSLITSESGARFSYACPIDSQSSKNALILALIWWVVSPQPRCVAVLLPMATAIGPGHHVHVWSSRACVRVCVCMRGVKMSPKRKKIVWV